MEKTFASPSRYIQGKGILKSGCGYVKKLGRNALLICDDRVWELIGKEFSNDLTENGVRVTHASFNGESSLTEIERISGVGIAKYCNVVIGLGGGKCIDTAKAISDQLQIPVAIIPTIASSDAPTSALSVIYTEEGTFSQYMLFNKNPELVLVDTEVIAKSPTRLLVSGMADAMATWIEGRAVIESGKFTMAGGKPTLAAAAIAQKCEETLFKYGIEALEASMLNEVNEALEKVVEANTLLSGIGFESCGLAAAHAVHNGFTALGGPVHDLTHGEKVAYGILTQLVLEKRPASELDKYIGFFQKLGLPTTLHDLHLDQATPEEILKIGKQAAAEGETIHNMPFAISPQEIADAILAVDAYVLEKGMILTA